MKKIIIRRVYLSPDRQHELLAYINKEREEEGKNPWGISMVRNYLNATKFTSPLASKVREIAVNNFGGVIEKHDKYVEG